MIASLFGFVQNDIQEDYSIKNLKDYLFKAGALKVFEGIYTDYPEVPEKIITYLIYAYSIDSSFVVSGEDWSPQQKGIMELLKLDCEKYADVLSFKRQSIKDAILFLSHEVKDLRYHEIVVRREAGKILDTIATTLPDSKSKGGAKNIADAIKASHENKLMITQLENEIRQQTKSAGRLKEIQTLDIQNMSMESILKSIK
jgi:hypothetical protein